MQPQYAYQQPQVRPDEQQSLGYAAEQYGAGQAPSVGAGRQPMQYQQPPVQQGLQAQQPTVQQPTQAVQGQQPQQAFQAPHPEQTAEVRQPKQGVETHQPRQEFATARTRQPVGETPLPAGQVQSAPGMTAGPYGTAAKQHIETPQPQAARTQWTPTGRPIQVQHARRPADVSAKEGPVGVRSQQPAAAAPITDVQTAQVPLQGGQVTGVSQPRIAGQARPLEAGIAGGAQQTQLPQFSQAGQLSQYDQPTQVAASMPVQSAGQQLSAEKVAPQLSGQGFQQLPTAGRTEMTEVQQPGQGFASTPAHSRAVETTFAQQGHPQQTYAAGAAGQQAAAAQQPSAGGATAMAGTEAVGGSQLESSVEEAGVLRGIPSVDVMETPDEIKVYADFPGFELDDIEVLCDESTLTLLGRRTVDAEEDATWITRERPTEIERQLQLPARAVVDDAEATCEKGVCTIRLPKSEEGRQKRIGFQ